MTCRSAWLRGGAVVVLGLFSLSCGSDDSDVGGAGGGAAGCPPGQSLCGGSCVNTDSDRNNCGVCGTICGPGEECVAGSCEPAAPVVTASCTEAFVEDESCAASSGGTVYYVSANGSDTNDGLSEDSPIQTLEQASELAVGPGDSVLFRCGDVWRTETLVIRHSGAECQHVVYGSYPAACSDQPRFSGSYPISGWTLGANNVWSADLSAGDNAGHFPNGINQLFRGEERLPLGRWPNRDDAEFPGGYSHIVTHSGGDVVGDPRLPSGDWSGAVFHHFDIRWLLLNSTVQSSGDGTLTLAHAIDCYDGCGDPDTGNPDDFGWGYFLAHHRLTLDQQDEWFYDSAANQVLLVSSAEPSEIEGSVIPEGVVDAKDPTNDEGYHGLVELGGNMEAPIHHVVLENLRLENGWRDGIATPINPQGGENTDLTVRCNTVRNVDSKGINLASWPLGPDDWRGGEHISVVSNVFDGPNHFGIRSVACNSMFQDNVIMNVGLIDNLGPSGLGCPFGSGLCTENGDGILLERFDDGAIGSTNVTVRRNRISRVGYCGIDTLGLATLIEENVVDESCYSKGDCGAIRTFGVSDVAVRRNIVRDVISPLEGFNSSYHERFGFGLYIDMGTTGNCEQNTITRAQGFGIIYQEGSTGDVTDNIVYDVEGRTLVFSGFEGTMNNFTGNVMVAAGPMRLMFTEGDGRILTSDNNAFIQPYSDDYISMQSADWVDMNLADWQAFSGQDGQSIAAWFSLPEGTPPITELFVNDTAEEQTVTLDRAYVDLDQQAVVDSITLPPFSSRVLVAE